MENEEEIIDSTNDEQETTDSTNGDDAADTGEKEEYTPREKQYYARIKKLEDDLKAAKAAPKSEAVVNTTGLSAADILAITKANLDEDDMGDVQEWATFKKIPIHEALRSPVLKATLAEKAEQRKSAQAVNTGSVRRPGSSVSDDTLMANANNGIMPSSDEDLRRLTQLRLKARG